MDGSDGDGAMKGDPCKRCGTPVRSAKGQVCGKCRRADRRAKVALIANRVCARCGGNTALSYMHAVCNFCRYGGRDGWNAYKRKARRSKHPDRYAPKPAPSPKPAQPKRWTWTMHPEVAALVARGVRRAAAVWRVRYAEDHVFRAKQIQNAQQRHVLGINKGERRHTASIGDGTLTGPLGRQVLRLLFGWQQQCPYCSRAMTSTPRRPTSKTLDHVIPLSRGGTHSADNVIVCCASCNTSKGARTLEEWKPTRDAQNPVHKPTQLCISLSLSNGLSRGGRVLPRPADGGCRRPRTLASDQYTLFHPTDWRPAGNVTHGDC